MNSCCRNHSAALPLALLGLLLVGGCHDPGEAPLSDNGLCQAETTPVSVIQGNGFYSPFEDRESTVSGVVTYVSDGEGFYLEDTRVSATGEASRAIFVADDSLAGKVEPGQLWAVAGTVAERGKKRDRLTSLIRITAEARCGELAELPRTASRLPLGSVEREALEGMRVSFDQALTVTDHYNLMRGELTLSAGGVLQVPTERVDPGPQARALADENRQQSLTVTLPGPEPLAVPLGSSVNGLSGLLGHDGRGQLLLADARPDFDVPADDEITPAHEQAIRIVSSNLLNFFNGDGQGGGFPTERGAKSPAEFRAQSQRTRAALAKMQPDLLAVQELENDGFGPLSAAESLLALLNDTGHRDWAVVVPGTDRIGTDVITVGLFYRQQRLRTVGRPQVLQGPAFDRLSRPPLAQVFEERASGERFLVAVDHLKSKGRCPDGGDNADQGDGQGCWNAARVAAVRSQAPWLEGLAAEAQTGHMLVLGDMNAWRREDPIRQFEAAGLIDLVARIDGTPQHSFLYWGQTGTLDYVFASPTLADRALHAQIWHINAGWPRGMTLPRPWLRTSDHDPVVVDFDFSQAAVSD